MLDIISLLKNSELQSSRWKTILDSKQKDNHFLYALSPVFEYLYQQLTAKLDGLTNLQQVVSKEFLKNFIEKDVVMSLKWLVSRCCALEMYTASQNDFLKGETREDRFESFNQQLAETDNIVAMIEKYGELVPLLNAYIKHYLQSFGEFLQHLNDDWQVVAKAFMSTSELMLTKIDAAGDTHCEGRRVFILTFNDDEKVVYKPRSLAVDIAFQNFTHWYNQHASIDLLVQNIIDQGNHGWCEFITHQSCDNEGQLKRFYQRLGALLNILNMLGGHDIHSENLIAHGEHPVIIDFECFFKPYFLPFAGGKTEPMRSLVSSTLILPYRVMSRNGFAGIDMSAFGGDAGQDAPYKSMEWENPGTDEMRIVRLQRQMAGNDNQPKLKDKPIQLADYQQAMYDGFTESYQDMLQQRNVLLGEGSPLNDFDGTTIRLLFRSTSEYAKMMVESYHPKLLYYPEERVDHFDVFNELIENGDYFQSMVDAEHRDMQEKNIPFFTTKVDSHSVFGSHGDELSLKLLMSGKECVRDYIADVMSDDDLQLQQRLIQNSFFCQALNQDKAKITGNVVFDLYQGHSLDEAALQQRARSMAEQLLDQVMTQRITIQGSIAWPTIDLQQDVTWNPTITRNSLYSGNMGMALAFAYAGRDLEREDYTEIAKQCVASIREDMKNKFSDVSLSCGAHGGLGGVIYGFGKLTTLWQDDSLIDNIKSYLPRLEKLIDEDEMLDIIGGSAGCLLSLLSVREQVGEQLFFQHADRCADRILQIYPEPSQSPEIDDNAKMSERPLLGFSHGVTGMAYALQKYNVIAKRKDVAQWLVKAHAYEQEHFCQDNQNWPDFREHDDVPEGQVSYMSAWCHGSPGVGLAKLDLYHHGLHDDLDVIKATINNTMQKGFNRSLCLCHGGFGNFKLLSQAVKYPELMDRDDYLRYYYSLLDQLQKTIEQGEDEYLHITPAFMIGAAGVAYALLQSAGDSDMPRPMIVC